MPLPHKIDILAIGKKPPAWVQAGWQDYVKRLPKHFAPNLIEINSASSKQFLGREALVAEEGKRLLQCTQDRHIVIALDSRGKPWQTEYVAAQLQNWSSQSVQILIGGSFGLSDACLLRANQIWSLSSATFAHPIVRIILAEQLYRVWCLITNHPYNQK